MNYVLAYPQLRNETEFPNKNLTVSDLADCVCYLVSEGITAPEIIYAESNSAGASLLLQSINTKYNNRSITPNWKLDFGFRAMVLNSPFCDILNQLNKNTGLSNLDFPEFGNPGSEKDSNELIQFDAYINMNINNSNRSSSENLLKTDILINAFRDDYRTPLINIYKTVLKLRDFGVNVNFNISEGSHNGKGNFNDNFNDEVFNAYFFEHVFETDNTVKDN